MIRPLALILLLTVAQPASASPLQPWERHIAEASSRFGIPEAWIRRVILAESGGRASWRGRPVRSSAGAMGLMQLMPGTWRAMRAAHGLGADPDDPRDNILAGTAYLRAMYDRFGYPGLFAAYNAGPARYADHLARGTRLPAETIDYLAKVAGVQWAGLQIVADAQGTQAGSRRISGIFPLGASKANAAVRRTAVSGLFFEFGGSTRPSLAAPDAGEAGR